MFQPQRILVPMDFSDEAMLALDWAIMVAKQVKGVTIFPTYVYSTVPDLVAIDVGRRHYRTVTHDWVEQRMDDVRMALAETARCEPLYATGNAAIEIVTFCETKGIDLVVMTTHGREGLSHLLRGNVAEAIVRKAPCPVLVLHMNRRAVEPVHDAAMHREIP